MVLQFRRNFSRLQPIPNPSPSGEGSLVIGDTKPIAKKLSKAITQVFQF